MRIQHLPKKAYDFVILANAYFQITNYTPKSFGKKRQFVTDILKEDDRQTTIYQQNWYDPILGNLKPVFLIKFWFVHNEY